jgi:hypothetical protein
MIALPFQPAPDSELGRALTKLEALREEAHAAQQELANLREELSVAGTALRRARYSPRHGEPTPLELDELVAAADELQARFDRQMKIARPILAALNSHEEATERLFADYQRAQRVAAELERLGGRPQ